MSTEGAPAPGEGLLIGGPRRLRRLAATALALALVGGLCFSWLAGGRLVAPNLHAVKKPAPGEGGLAAGLAELQDFELQSASGSTLAGWYLPAKGGADARAVVVLLHPKEGDRRAMLGRASLLAGAGYASVLVDLQAHGMSPGEKVTLGYLEREDARAAVAFAKEREPGKPVAVIGWSLGGVAAVLAGPLDIDALVVEEVFASLEQAVSDRFDHHMGTWARLLTPLLTVQVPLRLGVSTDKLNVAAHLAGAGCPVLVLGGAEDPYSPPAASRELFDAAPEPKALVLFEGAGHTDLLRHDHERYAREVLGFLAAELGGEAR